MPTRSVPPELEVPTLPAIFSFDESRRRLTVSLAKRRLKFPVIPLRDARLSTIQSLLEVREPHVILAPHLSLRAKELIEGTAWGWIETSGNAHISADGVFIHIERPDERTARSSGLAIPPQGERIIRLLLDAYPRRHRFSEIANATHLDRGYTSRILRRIRDTGVLVFERNEPVELTFPAELFELWQSVPPRAVESLWALSDKGTDEIASAVTREMNDQPHAFTGLYAATLLAPHMEPERVDSYIPDQRTAQRLAKKLGAEPVKRGGNLALLVPRDPSIASIGTTQMKRATLASTSQIYRDTLLRGRGREREAASFLRRERLSW